MHNRPDKAQHWGQGGPRAPVGSEWRMAALVMGWVLVLGVIGARAVWLQTSGRELFTSLWDRETERFETIPARNGRILTADGQVLAFDQPRYAIAVHYRWLETPPDPDWLRSQALSRLERHERRDREQVAEAEAAVLRDREQMHVGLAQATGLSAGDLQAKFQQVQSRIERIVAAVEARRHAESSETEAPEPEDLATTGWRGLWDRLRLELTTAPRRPQREPVVVAEELQYHEIIHSASVEVIGRIESFPTRFPGVDSRLTTERVYPQRDLAVHLIGVRTPLKAEELESRAAVGGADPHGYRVGEPIGRIGIELACDSGLHGRSGLRRVVTNRQGEILRQEVTRSPVHGRDVVLSIDGRLQQRAEMLLDEVVVRGERPATTTEAMTPDTQSTLPPQPQGGCLIAIDVRTGELLAAAASPRFDNRLLVSATTSEWEAAASDPRRPFFPRVTQAALPPGSVFKTLTAIAGIEAGVIDPSERFECQGYLERPDRERCAIFRHFGVGHGAITLDDALAQSCNVYFFDAAKRLGPEPILTWARRFGCGVATGIDIPGDRPGHLPQPGQSGGEAEPWYPGTTRQLAVGQASLTMTPLQVARMMAAIANDGWLVTPHLLRDVSSPQLDGDPSASTGTIQLAGLNLESTGASPPPVRIPGLSPGTLAQVRRGLIQAVEHPRGTGREALLQGVRIAGKTGTAEIGAERPDHAWFAGYAPADAPKIAFVVVFEQGGSGGRMAAPLAREFVQSWSESSLSPRSVAR